MECSRRRRERPDRCRGQPLHNAQEACGGVAIRLLMDRLRSYTTQLFQTCLAEPVFVRDAPSLTWCGHARSWGNMHSTPKLLYVAGPRRSSIRANSPLDGVDGEIGLVNDVPSVF